MCLGTLPICLFVLTNHQQAIAMGLRDAGATLTRLHLMLEISNMPILSTPRKWRIVNEFCLIPCVPLLRSVREIITLTRLVGGPGFNVFDTKVDADGESKIIKRQFLMLVPMSAYHLCRPTSAIFL